MSLLPICHVTAEMTSHAAPCTLKIKKHSKTEKHDIFGGLDFLLDLSSIRENVECQCLPFKTVLDDRMFPPTSLCLG